MRALLPVWALLLPLLLPPVDVVAQDTTLGPLLESQVGWRRCGLGVALGTPHAWCRPAAAAAVPAVADAPWLCA